MYSARLVLVAFRDNLHEVVSRVLFRFEMLMYPYFDDFITWKLQEWNISSIARHEVTIEDS